VQIHNQKSKGWQNEAGPPRIRPAREPPPPVKEALPPKKKKKQSKNNPHFHLADELQRITGVDLTRIDGVDVMVAQTVINEVGLDTSHWKTEAHFASWLGLCPDNRINGD
jgi:transposase